MRGAPGGSFQREMTSRGYKGGGLGQRRARAHPAVDRSKPGYSDADGYETVDAWACVDGCPIKALDEQAGSRTSPKPYQYRGKDEDGSRVAYAPGFGYGAADHSTEYGDTGGPSRFFPTFGPDPEDAVPFRYQPKASRRERNAGCADIPGSVGQHYGLTGQGPLPQQTPHHHRPQSNGHPTVKPTALMAWLCKLVTPEGGVVLDCFCGSGSTGVACVREGFGFLGIEQSAEYVAIARARIAHEQERRDGQLALPLGHAYG